MLMQKGRATHYVTIGHVCHLTCDIDSVMTDAFLVANQTLWEP